MAYEIFLIGLDHVGASIGLALSQAEGELERIGFDPDRKIAKAAKEMGAVDRTVSNPQKAAKTADLLIFSLPYHEVEVYLENLASKLKPEAILIDTAPIKAPFFAWVEQYLPAYGEAIGATPILGALEQGDVQGVISADRFAGGLLAITSTPNTSERAMTVAINLAKILDAQPFFLDLEEHDAATAALEDLPMLLNMALFRYAAESPSWNELQRMAGEHFSRATELSAVKPANAQRRLVDNREKILARMDLFITELGNLRDLLRSGSDDDLEHFIEELQGKRIAWLHTRAKGDWGLAEAEASPDLDRGGFLGQLFGFRQRKPRSD